MLKLPFVKMHGLGNDFIVLDDIGKVQTLGRRPNLTPELARKLCDRRFGIGADQILSLRPAQSREADARMEILNADGSVAEMCGNGIRAIALYMAKYGAFPNRGMYTIETLAGLKSVQIQGDRVAVDMGVPGVRAGFKLAAFEAPAAAAAGPGEEIEAGGKTYRFYEVDMGNPHAVIFVDDVSKVDLEREGALLEMHPRFPGRSNIEFVEIVGPGRIQARIWERGSGATLACGTGACAAAVAALGNGKVHGEVKVILPGGELLITWPGTGQSVVMEGPATEVFRGEFLVPESAAQ